MSTGPSRMAVGLAFVVVILGATGCGTAPRGSDSAAQASPRAFGADRVAAEPVRLRIAVFNVRELSTTKLRRVDDGGAGTDPQVVAAARIVQRVRPDILVVQEIDHDLSHPDRLEADARCFEESYLASGEQPIRYPHLFIAPNNTGRLSGIDLDGDGVVATAEDEGTRRYGGDCFGYGSYPGQYSMAVLSRLPFDDHRVRTFQMFRWKDLPGHHIPAELSSEARDGMRLSSKSHWDLPVRVGDRSIHLFVSHPTPPVFDGPEDLNGRRNFDVILFWL
ncbi:MAG: endonuclease/exonuclease/phosphatase family protein, partial [Planctomycetes bacterium]|nr:endonuclease/exonuclease/phosphatase family protein [Planctomycetota bacterium]